MSRRDRRARATGRLGMERGERYALIPREVMESEAYRALPPYAVLVLLALAVQYIGSRNGSLALPWTEAARLGVRTQAQLYGGLQLLQAVQLIACTRRGHLTAGKRLATLYALTWRAVDDPAAGVTYDAGMSMSLSPSHEWSRWVLPAEWNDYVRTINRRAKGKGGHECPFIKKSDSPRGERSTHPVGSDTPPHHSPRGEREGSISAHPVGVTSETLALGALKLARGVVE